MILHLSTSYLYIILAKSKSEMVDQILNIEQTHLTKHGIDLKRIHSESDSIYKSKAVRSFALKKNITLSFTAPYRHEGSIEAYMQSVLDMLRAMMIDGNINPKLWDYVLTYALPLTAFQTLDFRNPLLIRKCSANRTMSANLDRLVILL